MLAWYFVLQLHHRLNADKNGLVHYSLESNLQGGRQAQAKQLETI